MVENIRIKEVGLNDLSIIEELFNGAGNSTNTFRYFNSRPYNVISNHLLTIVAFKDGMPVGYGHLDREDEKVWLGIAVAENSKGLGLGKKIMTALTTYADKESIPEISLTVDEINVVAIKLYKQYNFSRIRNISDHAILMKRKKRG